MAACPGVDAEAVGRAVSGAWELFDGPADARLEVVFLSAKEHTRLHAEFLDDPSETDVMAFPYEDEDLYGEVLVNVDRAADEARRRSIETANECLLYVVHGALHLLGFRDDEVDARRAMRSAERRVLTHIGVDHDATSTSD